MTNKVKRASILQLASSAAFCWLMIYVQIKTDSKKGKLIIKTLKTLLGTFLVFAAIGTTSLLGFKVYKTLNGKQ